MLTQSRVDLARFRSDLREADIEEMVDTLLRTFLDDAHIRVAALENAVKGGNAKTIESAAHAFKSGAGTIRATRLADLLKEVEDAARTNGETPLSGDVLDQMRTEYAAVRLELETMLGNAS